MTYCDSCGHPAGFQSITLEVNGKFPTLNFCGADACQKISDAELHALALKHQDRRRYADTRKLITWNSPKLKVTKMLAHIVMTREGAGKDRLWQRVKDLYPQIAAAVIPEAAPQSFDELCADVLARFGVPLTAEKLFNRADKTGRNREYNQYLAAVEQAYLRVTKKVA